MQEIPEPQLFRSEEHTSELQSLTNLVCRLLLEKKRARSEEHTSELQSLTNLACRLLLVKKDPKKYAPDASATVRIHVTFVNFLDLSPSILRDIIALLFFNDTATTEIYTLSLHDALPISTGSRGASPTRPLPPSMIASMGRS